MASCHNYEHGCWNTLDGYASSPVWEMLFLSLLKLVDNNVPAAITMNMGVEDAVFEPVEAGGP